MEMVLVRLTAPVGPAPLVGPEVAVDLLWAAALPGDRLEHVRARAGPDAREIDLALFHRTRSTAAGSTATAPATAGPGPGPEAAEGLSLGLCRRAIDMSPALARWHAILLPAPGPPDPCHP